MIRELLTEAYSTVRKAGGVDPTSPNGFKRVLADDSLWSLYVHGLTEHLDPTTKGEVVSIAESTRVKLLENSMYQLNPYETLAMPILSIFYPRLIARELVTVAPIDKPEVIKAVLRPYFIKYNDPNRYDAPSFTDVSSGPKVDISSGGQTAVPGTHDILAAAGLTSDSAHLQKDFYIYEVTFTEGTNTDTVQVDIRPDVDGNFSAPVHSAALGVDDIVTGHIDYLNGTVSIASVNGKVTSAKYAVTISLEENTINTKVKLEVEKLRLVAKDRQISAEWSIQLEQDLKALFDIEIQSELVTIIGQQISLDIDKEIINHLLAVVQSPAVPNTHIGNFSTTPPTNFTWGPKQWAENILPEINKVSAAIYADTNIKAGNLIALNPLDAAILENINTFVYDGNSVDGGDLGYQTATLAGGKYKVLVSPVIPQGKALITYKPDVEMQVVYYYAPYQMPVISPYPLGNKPSLTVLTRYANSMVRPLGLGLINITA